MGKNVQNLKIFWKRAGDCMQLLHALNCYNRPWKAPLIPPLQIGYTLVSNFKKIASIFNKLFVSQCVPLNNDSKIPNCQRHMINAKISSFKFENSDIINVIKALDPCRHMDMMIHMWRYRRCVTKILWKHWHWQFYLKVISVKAYFQIIAKNQIPHWWSTNSK